MRIAKKVVQLQTQSIGIRVTPSKRKDDVGPVGSPEEEEVRPSYCGTLHTTR